MRYAVLRETPSNSATSVAVKYLLLVCNAVGLYSAMFSSFLTACSNGVSLRYCHYTTFRKRSRVGLSAYIYI